MTLALRRLLHWMPGGFLVALSHIVIDEEAGGRLVLDVNGGQVSFDQQSRVVSFFGGRLVSFSSIASIELVHFTNGKRFEWWELGLQLQGGKRLRVGRSTDGTEAAIVAAHVATITGKRVCALERVGF